MDTTLNPNHTVRTPDEPSTTDAAGLSAGLRLHSLAELGQVLTQLASATDDAGEEHLSLDEALTLLASSEDDLAAATATDAEARHAAEDLLARYDQAHDATRRAEDAVIRANALVARAGELAEHPFTPVAQDTAQRALATVQRVAEALARARSRSRAAEAALANDSRVSRLLAERQAQEEVRQREAAQAEQRTRLASAVEQAQALAAHGQLPDALALLAPFTERYPDAAPLVTLTNRLRQEVRAQRLQRAQATLWEIRRRLRTRPAEVLVAVEQIDFADLDDDLARQLFGEWLRAARQLDLPGALRCTPEPHRGALLVPHGSETILEVVSAVGGSPLVKGQIIPRHALRGLRPLAEPRR